MECRYCCYYLVILAVLPCYYVIAFDWPEGNYGLPMANTGCPSGATFDWKSGWIYQDTENNNPANRKSASFHLEGGVKPSTVNRSFCIKTEVTNDERRPLWPAGTYCIHQRTNNCPLGFNSGSITWDDEDDNNKNNKSGTLPKVDLQNSNTEIYFCCRKDGFKTNPIDFPSVSPFYLFAHQSMSCQQVKWAVATSEWILYDTEDYHNVDTVQFATPYVEQLGKQGKIKIFYCYYTSCQCTLNASSGTIKFPSHYGNYANGQLCSWKITVKASQFIQVHFVSFQLSYVNDQLIFYDGKDDSAPLLATLYGKAKSDMTSRVIHSSSSNLFLFFRSNHVNTASGFQASYTAIGTIVTVPPATSATTAESTTATTTRIRTRTTSEKIEKTNPTEVAQSSPNPPSKSSSEPTSLPSRNSSKSIGAFKKTCIQQSQSTLTAVATVIPLICLIAVIAMAMYLFYRLRKIREKPSDVSVRYSTPTTTTTAAATAAATSEPTDNHAYVPRCLVSVNNPAYISSDAVIEASGPSTNNDYEDCKGDIYDEIESNRRTVDNPLYQSTDEDKHVYARVTPLFKKGDKQDPYRPISILPTISKVFEKAVHSQLYNYLSDNNLLSPNQYGFRLNSSTVTATAKFTDKILTSMDDGKLTGAVFLDLTKAFDTVNHSILLSKLKQLGVVALPTRGSNHTFLA